MAETQTGVSSARLRQDYQDASPSQIKADIDRTRAEMDRTLDRLSAELEPRRIMEEIMNAFNINRHDMAERARCMTRDTGQALWASLRENPVPLALIGLGVGWLAYNQYKAQSGASFLEERRVDEPAPRRRHPVGEEYSAVDARTGEPYTASYGEEFAREFDQPEISSESETETAGRSVTEKLSEMGEQVKEKGKHMLSGAREKLSQLGQKLSTSGEGRFSHAGERLSQVRERVSEKMQQAGEQFAQGKDVAKKTLRDYPLAAGGIAVMLGAAGATVYCTGRSVRGNRSDMNRPETIEETAEMVTAAGGTGIPVRVDHRDEAQVRELFARERRDGMRITDLTVRVPTLEESYLALVERAEQEAGTGTEMGTGTEAEAVPA